MPSVGSGDRLGDGVDAAFDTVDADGEATGVVVAHEATTAWPVSKTARTSPPRRGRAEPDIA
jgi:hypothetical protein